MIKEMKMKCRVGRIDDTGRFPVTAKLFDGTEFTVRLRPTEVILTEDFGDERDVVDGWMLVVQEAKQHSQVSICLPQPSDQHGRQIVTNQYELIPRHLSI